MVILDISIYRNDSQVHRLKSWRAAMKEKRAVDAAFEYIYYHSRSSNVTLFVFVVIQ